MKKRRGCLSGHTVHHNHTQVIFFDIFFHALMPRCAVAESVHLQAVFLDFPHDGLAEQVIAQGNAGESQFFCTADCIDNGLAVVFEVRDIHGNTGLDTVTALCIILSPSEGVSLAADEMYLIQKVSPGKTVDQHMDTIIGEIVLNIDKWHHIVLSADVEVMLVSAELLVVARRISAAGHPESGELSDGQIADVCIHTAELLKVFFVGDDEAEAAVPVMF